MMKRTIMNLASKCLIGILGIATLAGTASCDKSESLLGQISVTVTAPAEHAVDLSTVKVTISTLQTRVLQNSLQMPMVS